MHIIYTILVYVLLLFILLCYIIIALLCLCIFLLPINIGLAGYADFKSAPSGIEPQSFVLEWSSESQSPITEFELMWREEGGEFELFPVPSHKENSFNWSGKYALNNLKPATRYEAKVVAKNDLGWSRPCPPFHFATFGAGEYLVTKSLLLNEK